MRRVSSQKRCNRFCATCMRYAALARMSDSGVKSSTNADLAASTVACDHGWPCSAASARTARCTVAAMPPNASRTSRTVSPSSAIAKPAHTAEISQSKRLLIL